MESPFPATPRSTATTPATGAIFANKTIKLAPSAGNTIAFQNASDTLATGATGWLHIGGEGETKFADGFNNPGLTTVHFGEKGYTAYSASAGWANSTAMNVTQNSAEFSTVSSGWAASTGSNRATPYSAVTGNFVLGDNQILSLDMSVANNIKVPYFTVAGSVANGTNTTLYGVIGSALSTALEGSKFTYAIFNTTGDATGFGFANYRTSNKLVTLANPTFYGNATGGTFTVDVERITPPFNGSISTPFNKTVNHGTTGTSNLEWIGDITVTSGGNYTVAGQTLVGNGGVANLTGNFVVNGTGSVNFTGNSATKNVDAEGNGGAIYAEGSVTFSGTGTNTFTNNNASTGGAIYATGNVTLSGGTNTFTSNNASTGGAIYAKGNVTLSGGTNTFTSNNASTGGAIYAAEGNIYLTPGAGNVITFKNASDTLATGKASAWLHIGGAGETKFEGGFHNPGLTTVHFGENNYTAYDASTGWANTSAMNVTQNAAAFSTVSSGWIATTGSNRATPYSAVTGNFVLGDNQILSLDMSVANSTNIPYFTVKDGSVTSGTNTTLYGVIGSTLSTALAGSNFTYAVFNVTDGNGAGFAPANYRTSNKLVTLANPTFYGDANGGTFTVDVKRTVPTPDPDPDPPIPPDPPVPPDPDPPVPPVPPVPPHNGTVIPVNETHSGGVAENGGGLYSNGTTSITKNATADFTGNTAYGSGGGLNSADSVTVQDNASAVFSNNTAAKQGGGMYSGGNITSAGTTAFVATGNTANQGGGMYANGTVTLSGTADFTGNTAKEKGGAIFATGDVKILGSANFNGNTAATEGGAIYTDKNVHVTPEEKKSIRFVTHSDSIHANNLYVDGNGTGYFNATNAIGNTVYVKSGTAQLAAANTFTNTSIRVDGGTLHMGGVTSNQPKSRMAAMPAAAGDGSVTGAGSATSYATNLKGFHLGDGTTLSLDMNVAGNANVPYFTLANGYAATTGTGTTVYGVIGSALSSAADGKWTYSIFSGSNGVASDFTPANYRTSNTLVSLANPTYVDGKFTLDVVRTSQPEPPVPPDPVPPVPDPVPPVPDPVPPVPPKPDPKPVITGDFMGLFPKNSLKTGMEMILHYDYFYNGGTIANPGPGTLIGQNAFMDGLMLVLPNGQDAFTPEQRLLALESAASMADMSGSIEMLRDSGNRLRNQIFATDAVRNNRASMIKNNDGTRINLWATPTYSHETGKDRGQYGSTDAGYRYNMYGGMIGLDTLFADGKFRVGGVFTVGRGDFDSKGDGMKTTNDANYTGGAVFGAWLPTPEWELGIYTGYIGQTNDVEQANILKLESDFDTSLWQFGANIQYSKSIGNDGKRKLTAGAGVDAQKYKRDSHSISANGKKIANMGKSDLNQVQIPLTVGIQDNFEFENGSSLTVDGRLGYRLTAGDLATESDWSIPGGSHKARITGPDADRNTALAGVGAVWRKDQFSIGVSYDAEIGKKRTNHQLSGQVRWEF